MDRARYSPVLYTRYLVPGTWYIGSGKAAHIPWLEVGGGARIPEDVGNLRTSHQNDSYNAGEADRKVRPTTVKRLIMQEEPIEKRAREESSSTAAILRTRLYQHICTYRNTYLDLNP